MLDRNAGRAGAQGSLGMGVTRFGDILDALVASGR